MVLRLQLSPPVLLTCSLLPQSVCTFRIFAEDNSTQWPNWGYRSEPALHEMLLMSPHRTLDPEQADFFYVPVYSSCYIWPVWGWADAPWFGPSGQPDGGPGGECCLHRMPTEQARPL